jgi:DNA-binding transcriptional LysR family regulator
VRLPRKATGYDQESIATLILSGRFLGFLPDHYALGFVQAGLMRAVKPALFRYECGFFGIVRRSPQPARVTLAFQNCLRKAHAGPAEVTPT